MTKSKYGERKINDNYGVFENDLRELYLVVNEIQFKAYIDFVLDAN